MTTIYALVDPRDSTVRYVGRTKDLHRRLLQHSHSADRRRHKWPSDRERANWISGLRAVGLEFHVAVLDECVDDVADIREMEWIDKYMSKELLNRMPFSSRGRSIWAPPRFLSQLIQASAETRGVLNDLIRGMGVERLAPQLRVSPRTLLLVAGGHDTRRMTILRIEKFLKALPCLAIRTEAA